MSTKFICTKSTFKLSRTEFIDTRTFKFLWVTIPWTDRTPFAPVIVDEEYLGTETRFERRRGDLGRVAELI